MAKETKRLRRRCEYCNKVYNVWKEGDFYNWRKQQGDLTVSWQEDPFDAEINGDYTRHWLCTQCASERAWEI